MRRIVLLALLVLGCASPILERSWLRVETPHFQLISGAGAERTREIARGLEQFRAVLERVGVQMNLEPRVPMLVYVFGDSAGYARFRPRSGVAGFMLPRSHRSFLVIDAGEEQNARATALHEYVHFVLRNGEAVHYPAWYDEGLAEFLSTVTIEEQRFVVGKIPEARVAWLQFGNPMSMRRVVTATDAYEWSDRALARFYAQVWALVHFFHLADRIGFADRRAQMARYLALLNRGVAPETAWEKAFGMDIETLERDFLRYIGEGQLPYAGASLARLALAEQVRTEPLAEHEKRYRLGELALALGEEWQGEAKLWFRLALEVRPEDPRAHAALGRVLMREDPDAASRHLARAVELAAQDPEVHRIAGEAMLVLGSGDGDLGAQALQRAREHFERSITIDPSQVAAYAGLGRSLLAGPAESDTADALASLRTAHQRLPADRSIALWLAEAEIAAGDTARARDLLTQMPPPSHGDPALATEEPAIERARLGAGLARAGPRATRHLVARLDLEAPQQGGRVRGLWAWAEVRGRGGLWEATHHDVVIALDESPSTLYPTGTDLDGDGIVGKRRWPLGLNPNSVSSDPDDTVVRAELEAARVLIRQLDPRTTRVAVLTFAGGATVRAPLGPPQAALDALDAYEVHVDPSGTSLASALSWASQVFFEGREIGTRRQRTIVLLSDGQPTVPSVRAGQRDAIELADQMGGLGVPIHAYALGKEALKDPAFYASLAERSDGSFIPVERPADVVSELASIRFTGLENVTIESTTTGRPGRAVRVFPDGSFDGYVPLVEGENLIAITGVVDGGETLTEHRTVFFERPAEPGPADERAAARMRKQLETRALELELLVEIRRGRRAGGTRRHLEVEIEGEGTGREPEE